ncbi:MAG: hypothetical protein ABIJ75_03520 [Actinomycetota bacterium]
MSRRVRIEPWCACDDPDCSPEHSELIYDPDGEYLLVRADLSDLDMEAATTMLNRVQWSYDSAGMPLGFGPSAALAVVRAALGIKEDQ